MTRETFHVDAQMMDALKIAVESLATTKAHVVDCTAYRLTLARTIDRVHERLDDLAKSSEVRHQEELERRDQRDRDTRMTRISAQIAVGTALFGAAVTIGLHFWK